MTKTLIEFPTEEEFKEWLLSQTSKKLEKLQNSLQNNFNKMPKSLICPLAKFLQERFNDPTVTVGSDYCSILWATYSISLPSWARYFVSDFDSKFIVLKEWAAKP